MRNDPVTSRSGRDDVQTPSSGPAMARADLQKRSAANFSFLRPRESRITPTSATVLCAASWAAATTKSLTERPWISAARRTTARASREMRVSRRAVRLVTCCGIRILYIYNVRRSSGRGKSPSSVQILYVDGAGFRAGLPDRLVLPSVERPASRWLLNVTELTEANYCNHPSTAEPHAPQSAPPPARSPAAPGTPDSASPIPK